jgi:hypothetical protein
MYHISTPQSLLSSRPIPFPRRKAPSLACTRNGTKITDLGVLCGTVWLYFELCILVAVLLKAVPEVLGRPDGIQ